MKKSYFAIGAIAAAMCSCSSESIPSVSEGNVLPGTEDLSPISLSMTGTNASVEMGSRTRGTGNVGGTNDLTWQNEKLYILMTSSDKECLKEDETWGFTTLNGAGPWLREQFNGAIWGRVNGTELLYKGTAATSPVNMKNNDWYLGAGVDRYYPVNGESQFFAFHVDDACEGTYQKTSQQDDGEGNTVNTTVVANFDYTTKAEYDDNGTAQTPVQLTDPSILIYNKSDDVPGGYNYPAQQLDEHYPKIFKDEATGQMSVKFRIDGTQDLMVGYAKPTNEYPKGFSAKSARHTVTPTIKMDHLLSRLKFIIHRGDEQAKNIQITGITIKKVKSSGNMIVAYDVTKEANDVLKTTDPETGALSPANRITWGETTNDFADFVLMNAPGTPLKGNLDADGDNDGILDADNDPLDNEKNKMVPLTPLSLKDIPDWYQPELGGNTKNQDNAVRFKEIGGGMFVAPSTESYEMVLDYKVLVRDNGNGEFDEPTQDNPETPDVIEGPDENDDLIEKMQVKYPLTAPGDGYEQGKSYNINITVYGLKPITATVELTKWEESGDVWIGGDGTIVDGTNSNDGKPENLPNPNPGQGQ